MFCVRVLEERAMSEKLFFVDNIFWHSVWDTSNLHNSPSAPNVMVMVISPLSLTTTSCLSHLWRLLSFWPRLTLGLAAKRRIVSRITCQLSCVTRYHGRRLKRSFVAGPRRKRSWTAWWARQCTTPGYGRRESTEQVSSAVSTRQPAAGSSRARLLIKYEISGWGRTDGWFHVKFYTNSNFWKL